MFKRMGKKIIIILCSKSLLIWTYGSDQELQCLLIADQTVLKSSKLVSPTADPGLASSIPVRLLWRSIMK